MDSKDKNYIAQCAMAVCVVGSYEGNFEVIEEIEGKDYATYFASKYDHIIYVLADQAIEIMEKKAIELYKED